MRDHAVAARDAVSRGGAGDMNDRRTSPTDFERLAARAISRRGFLCGTAACGATAFVLSAGGLTAQPARAAVAGLDFTPVAANGLDTVTVPDGYSWHVVARWGDPLWSTGAAFDQASRGTGESQEAAYGDNNDGMALFTDGDKNVLAVNNEYVNLDIMFANRESGKPETADDVRKCKAGHGVSVIEIAQQDGAWRIVQDSPYNRRITPDTPMEITGPARGHDLVKTATDPAGTIALGTWNNCGNGRTPWGTYLACEENFNGYFSSSDPDFALPAGYKRYGIKAEDSGYGWAMTDERFDVSKHPNEPNRAGYVVEIDPLDPASVPKKRTALGRFKHENAEVTLAADGRVVVYLGDDERGEFLYKFVSDGVYAEGGDNRDLLGSGCSPSPGSRTMAQASGSRSRPNPPAWCPRLRSASTPARLPRRTMAQASGSRSRPNPPAWCPRLRSASTPARLPRRTPKWAQRQWTGPNGWRPTRTRPRPTAASPTTRTAASSPMRAAT